MKIDHYPSCSDALEREQRAAHATAIELRELRDDLNYRFRETERRQNVEDAERREKNRISVVQTIPFENNQKVKRYVRMSDSLSKTDSLTDISIGFAVLGFIVLLVVYGVYTHLN